MVASAFSNTQIQITNEVEMLLRQRGGALMSYVRSGEHFGKKAAVVRQLGNISMSTVASPNADYTYQDIAHSLRFVEHKSFFCATLESMEEVIQAGNSSLVSHYSEVIYNSLRTKQDDLILSALFGIARVGESGGSTEAFDTTNQIVGTGVGGAASGLNPAKLDAARDILVKNGVNFDNDEVFVALTAADESSLLNYTQLTSADFTGPRPVLVDGKLNSYRGIQFVPIQFNNIASYPDSQAAMVLSTTVRHVPMWVKSGVYYANFKAPDVLIDTLPHKSHNVQVVGRLHADATRLENKKVVRMACTYAVGA